MAFAKWNGSKWVYPTFKKWNGSKWIDAKAWRWNGSKWVLISKEETTTVKLAIDWHSVYNGENKKRSDDPLLKTTMRFGFENNAKGLNKSLFAFNNIESLKGKEIVKARLFIRSFYWEAKHKGILPLGYHKHDSAPSTFSHSKYNVQRENFTDWAQSKWITLNSEMVTAIEKGNLKGFSIYINNDGKSYYGNFYGKGSKYPPVLEVTYKNN